MRFCQSFMIELNKYIGPNTDVPAGDIGVGGREIGYLFGQYKRLHDEFNGALTGKGLSYGGSLERTDATGYGLCYFTQKMLESAGRGFEGSVAVVSGSGNVALYACEKAQQLGAKVVAMSDSAGYIHDPDGIDIALMKRLKEVERKRIREYAALRPNAVYREGCRGIWQIPCQIALPCATQNELDAASARALLHNGCIAVARTAFSSPPARRPTRAASPSPRWRWRKTPCACSGRRRRSTPTSSASWRTFTAASRQPPRNTAAKATLSPVQTSQASKKSPTPCSPRACFN